MKIGVISIQGDVSEHVVVLKKVLNDLGQNGEVLTINKSGLVPHCDALVIPGGESTTLARLIARENIDKEIKDSAKNGIPILGTCAGLILLAKHGDEQVKKTKQKLLGLMDIWVNRNAFGRQRESFEALLDIPILGKEPFKAVFIRAPAITHCSDNVEILAKYKKYIVAVKQDNILALAFHPELTEDLRFHHYFLDMVKV
ncbi:MAG: pyridoxal 5'-phosphate synthase glutaminase subunit PdxT [Methanosarcinales archaeon]